MNLNNSEDTNQSMELKFPLKKKKKQSISHSNSGLNKLSLKLSKKSVKLIPPNARGSITKDNVTVNEFEK